jgi:hypothetical protein
MSFAEKNRIFLEKLQNLPDNKKKIILWTIVIILAATMGFFWINETMNGLSKLSKSAKSINLPDTNMLQISPATSSASQNLTGQATLSNK